MGEGSVGDLRGVKGGETNTKKEKVKQQRQKETGYHLERLQ